MGLGICLKKHLNYTSAAPALPFSRSKERWGAMQAILWSMLMARVAGKR